MVGHLSGTGEERAATPDAAARRDSPDLGRLNPPEQEVLHLLAEGHTAKSIASLTGRSVAAVNERLREARRKTGASSSRELARLLKAQKNRDEKIGVDGASGAEQSMPLEAVPPSRRSARPSTW